MRFMKRLIFDLDDTISFTQDSNYESATVNLPLVEKIKEYRSLGFEIVISTSRNVRTYEGNVGKINANTLPVIIEWLKRYDIPYDEIYVGKPWCGHEGFYVDDKAVRPSEFVDYSYEQIVSLLKLNKE